MGTCRHWRLCTWASVFVCMYVYRGTCVLHCSAWRNPDHPQDQSQKLLFPWSCLLFPLKSLPLYSALTEICSSLHILIYHIQINCLNARLIVLFKRRHRTLFVFVLYLQNMASQHSVFAKWRVKKLKNPKSKYYQVLLQTRPYSFQYITSKLYSY